MAFSDNYFKSKDIKVFPSSFRGTYEMSGGVTLVFDPEARLNTESNYTCPKTTSGKDTYIVGGDATSIKFVLGGYYFELSSLSDYKEKLKGKYIGIKLRSVKLKEGEDIDTTRETQVLDSWVDTSQDILDFEAEGTYYFSGLKFDTTLKGFSAQIKPLDSQGNLNKTYLLPTIQHGTGENTLLHGEGLKAASKNQAVFGKYNDNKSDTLFEIGDGTTEDSLDKNGKITQKNRKNALEIYADKAVINTPLEVTDTSDAALVVSGKTTVKKDLEIGDTTQVLVVKNNPSESEQNVTITGTLKSTDEATFENGLEVSSGKTILGGAVEISGKATSATTKSTDAPATLTTKGYVDSQYMTLSQKVDGLTSIEETAEKATGSYIQNVSQRGGTVTATKYNFETTLNAATDNNAPTSKAVSDFVKSDEIKRLMYNVIYPVGSIYMTMTNLAEGLDPITVGNIRSYAIFDRLNKADPAGGLWKRISQGRVLIGEGTGRDQSGKNVTLNATVATIPVTGGYYDPQPWAHWHKYSKATDVTEGTALKEENMPRHTHNASIDWGGYHSHTLELKGTKHDRSNIDNNNCIRVAATTDGAAVTHKTKTLEWEKGIAIDYSGEHFHGVSVKLTGGNKDKGFPGDGIAHTHNISLTNDATDTTGYYTPTVSEEGETRNMGNLPPYLVCYIWQRVR